MNLSRLVVNASPLISLARIGRADLLVKLVSDLVVPEGVCEEIAAHGVKDAAVRWIEEGGAEFVRAVEVPPEVAEWNLGKGESQVIAYACLYPGFAVALDDRPARRCANALGFRIVGTIALLIEAKRRRLVPEVAPLLLQLRANGFRVSDEVFGAAVRLSEEAQMPSAGEKML